MADRHGIVSERFLVDHPEGGEEQAPGHPLRVEGGQSGLRVAVGGTDRLPPGKELQRAPVVRVPPEVVVHRPGERYRVESRVGDRMADPPADHVVAPAVHLRPLDHP